MQRNRRENGKTKDGGGQCCFFFFFFLEFSRTQVSPLFPVSYLLMALGEVLLRTSCSYNLQCQGSRL